ncbi:pentapeptide repeat-containing protein [Amnibacterium flavum]|uniref:Pentapeptide repeat-containing protein n=1 Tax=Amnibacterium flavum TaxID=2173173 RepID=A0A2V1HRZ3_9MICO|nr:pentapeptide repeat-containing protein [Amnibacterium flavum]PVZ95365.1 hypothetical protein DDQ50_02270 [Amnibacterium flavum]
MVKARGLEAPRLSRVSLPHLEVPEPGTEFVDASLDALRLEFDTSEVSLDRSAVIECDLSDLRVEVLSADGSRFADVVATGIDVVTWRGHDSSWRDVEIGRGRIGSIDLSDSDLSSVRFSDLRIGYLDLRAATLGDVLFERCRIGTLDLPSATLKRVAFDSCTVDELDLRMIDCASVDIRGLEVGARLELAARPGREPLAGIVASPEQARDLAPVLARAAGLTLLD